jgi:hypothetical protein
LWFAGAGCVPLAAIEHVTTTATTLRLSLRPEPGTASGSTLDVQFTLASTNLKKCLAAFGNVLTDFIAWSTGTGPAAAHASSVAAASGAASPVYVVAPPPAAFEEPAPAYAPSPTDAYDWRTLISSATTENDLVAVFQQLQLHAATGKPCPTKQVRYIPHACHKSRVRHSVAIYGQLLLFCDQSMREKAWRSSKRGA